MRRRAMLAIGLAVAIAVAIVLHHEPTSAPARATRVVAKPNIVFILTDDLSWDLVRFMPHVAALQRRGTTFDHYFVSNSLCCPSRATIFTGDFPHDTKVLSNTAPLGGYAKFRERRLARRTFAVALQREGYATSLLGKYLNGYGDAFMSGLTAPVPPGWSDWHVANRTGYREFGSELNDNGRFTTYEGYGVDVLAEHASDFIARSGGQPFALEVATFAPHAPYTPAPRNADDFPGLTQPRDPSFDAPNVNPPSWLADRPPLGAERIADMDEDFRRRAQAVQAIDALVARVEQEAPKNTYIVFSSDNGYHMGQHRLAPGKMTAFDTDIRVPLIVAGPGVPKGRTVHQIAQNTDLAPTFVQLAGGTPDSAIDGHSLVPLLRDGTPTTWPTAALVEHRGPRFGIGDPDLQSDVPTRYTALRISSPRTEAVYVEYTDGEREYYDIARDPFELRNVVDRLTPAREAQLHAALARLRNCHDAQACWRAAGGAPDLAARPRSRPRAAGR
jgi:N-acetylglucosamine-6-sulfatase